MEDSVLLGTLRIYLPTLAISKIVRSMDSMDKKYICDPLDTYPLVNCYITMNNHHPEWVNQLSCLAILNGYLYVYQRLINNSDAFHPFGVNHHISHISPEEFGHIFSGMIHHSSIHPSIPSIKICDPQSDATLRLQDRDESTLQPFPRISLSEPWPGIPSEDHGYYVW